MARPRQNSNTRERLLTEGVSSFLTHGFHGTGLKEVLDRVSVPKGSFYNYFESKEEFGAAVIEHYAKCLAGKLSRARSQESNPLDGLRSFFVGLMEDFEAAKFTGGCLVANLGGELEGSEVCRTALAAAFQSWRKGVFDALVEAQNMGLIRSDLDAGELADVLIDHWEGSVIRMKIERSLEPLKRCLHRLFDDTFLP